MISLGFYNLHVGTTLCHKQKTMKPEEESLRDHQKHSLNTWIKIQATHILSVLRAPWELVWNKAGVLVAGEVPFSSWHTILAGTSKARGDACRPTSCTFSSRVCVLSLAKDGFYCFCFHVEKNICSPLQSKHSGSGCDCSDFYKDLDATYHRFSTAGNIMKLKSLVELFFSFFQP